MLTALAHCPLLLAMDGSEMGRGCLTLIVSVIYKKRALPVVWIVVRGSKRHFPEETHVRLIEQVHNIVPEGCAVIFLGDGEFDDTALQATIAAYRPRPLIPPDDGRVSGLYLDRLPGRARQTR